jgi:hypothetical protein
VELGLVVGWGKERTSTPVTSESKGILYSVNCAGEWEMDMEMDELKSLDILRAAARKDWLNPATIEKILLEPVRYSLVIHTERPLNPENGSLYLFSKKDVKNYKVDGIEWSKKPNGRIQETYSNIKVEGVEKLYGVYTTAEHNRNFQKRIYRLLSHDSYILVHYRECDRLRKQSRAKRASGSAGSALADGTVTPSNEAGHPGLPPEGASTDAATDEVCCT